MPIQTLKTWDRRLSWHNIHFEIWWHKTCSSSFYGSCRIITSIDSISSRYHPNWAPGCGSMWCSNVWCHPYLHIFTKNQLWKCKHTLRKWGSHWSMYNFNYEYITFLYVVHVYMFCNVALYCIALSARVLFAIKIIDWLTYTWKTFAWSHH